MMKRKKGLALLIACLMLVSMLPGTTFAAGTEFYVATTGSDTNPGTQAEPFATLQAAITAAAAGDTIHIAAGDYTVAGLITIDKDLTIVGEDQATTILRPDSDYVNWITVDAAADSFSLSHVTIDGAGHNIRAAIRTSGSGIIADCIIQNIRFSRYNGWGIAINWDVTGQTWTIARNRFVNIERVGVLVDGQGNHATLSDNVFSGKGTGDWVEYGIEVGDGAHAIIDGNQISNYRGVAATDGSISAGVFVHSYFGPNPQAALTGNTITANSYGVIVGYTAGDTSTVTIHNNSISGNDTSGVESSGPAVDAANNWWGDAGGPLHLTSNPAGLGNAVSDNVDYSPWLLKVTYTSEGHLFDIAENVILKAVVTNTDGSLPLEGATVSFYMDGVLAGQAATDAAGIAVLDVGVKPAGAYAVRAEAQYAAGEDTAAAETAAATTITVLPMSASANNLTHAYDGNYNTSANIFTETGYIIYNLNTIGLAPGMAAKMTMNAADGSAGAVALEFLNADGVAISGTIPAITGYKSAADFIVPAGAVYLKIFGIPLTALYIYEIEEDTSPGPEPSLSANNLTHAYDDNYNTSANIFTPDGYIIYSLADLGLAAETNCRMTMNASDGSTTGVTIEFLDASYATLTGTLPPVTGYKNAYVFAIPAGTVYLKIHGIPNVALYIYEIEQNAGAIPGPASAVNANNIEQAYDDNYDTSANIFTLDGYITYSLADLGLAADANCLITMNAADGRTDGVTIEFLDASYAAFSGTVPLVAGYKTTFMFTIPFGTVYLRIHGIPNVALYIYEIEQPGGAPGGPMPMANANSREYAYDDNYGTSANIFSELGYIVYSVEELGLDAGTIWKMTMNAADGSMNTVRMEFLDAHYFPFSGVLMPIQGYGQMTAFMVSDATAYIKIYGIVSTSLYVFEIEAGTAGTGYTGASQATNMTDAYDGNAGTSANIFSSNGYIIYSLAELGIAPGAAIRVTLNAADGSLNGVRVEYMNSLLNTIGGTVLPVSGYGQSCVFTTTPDTAYIKIFGLWNKALYLYEIAPDGGPSAPALSSNANNLDHAYDGNINTSANIFSVDGYIVYSLDQLGEAVGADVPFVMNAADGSLQTARIEFLDGNYASISGVLFDIDGFKDTYYVFIPAGTVYLKFYGLGPCALYIYEIG